MADVERIEFSQSVLAACASSGASNQTLFRRDRFIGKWQAQGGGANPAVYMTLKPDGHATRGASHGTWELIDGQARITWDNGWHDIIRKLGDKYEKFTYLPGKSGSGWTEIQKKQGE